MPNDMPYMQFYVNDFDNDTCGLSSAAVGVWIRLLIAMHRKRCGELSGTLDRLAKITRCTVPELDAALKEFESDDICYMKRDCNGVVTIICRRLKREEEKRASTCERVRKCREKKAAEQKNSDCNADVTLHARAYSQSQSQEKVSTVVDTKETTPAFNYPSSVEEILEIAARPEVGVRMTRGEAERYFVFRSSTDWIDAANRKILPARIGFDLKRWVLNSADRRKTQDDRKIRATEPGRENEGRDQIGF